MATSSEPCPLCGATLDGGFDKLLEHKIGADAPRMRMPKGAKDFGASTHAAHCPPVILSSDPTETGLGVWVLVASSDDDCEYAYAGGIA